MPSAAVRLVRNDSQLRSAVFELGKPCIVRSDCEHAQRDVTIVRNQEDLARCSLTSGTASAVLRLYDIRQEYRDVRGGFSHLFREYHHKARAFVIGEPGHGQPSVLLQKPYRRSFKFTFLPRIQP